jgi:hypothetical protein
MFLTLDKWDSVAEKSDSDVLVTLDFSTRCRACRLTLIIGAELHKKLKKKSPSDLNLK